MPTVFLEYHEYDGDNTVVTYRTHQFPSRDPEGKRDWSGRPIFDMLGFKAIGYAYRVWVEDDNGRVLNIYKDRDLSFDPKAMTDKERFLIRLRSRPLVRSI